jgi:hypothetical protein
MLNDFSFKSIFFSIWQTLIRVILNISPTSCSVLGPRLASMTVQFNDRGKSNHSRHDLLSHCMLQRLCSAKHVVFFTMMSSLCIDKVPQKKVINITIKNHVSDMYKKQECFNE